MTGAQTEVRPVGDDPSMAVNARAWSLIRAALFHHEGENLYAIYAELHKLGVDFLTPNGTHVVIGYAALGEMMRNPMFRKNNAFGASQKTAAFSDLTVEQQQQLDDLYADSAPMLGSLDAPDHLRIRNLVQRAFTVKYVHSMRAKIASEIDELLSRIDPAAPADISSQFGALFAPEIMAELIGLPSEDRAYMARLTATYMRGIDPAAPFELRLASARAAHAQRQYVRKIVEDRRQVPRDDLVTALVADPASLLSERELVQLLTILYIGGYETTAHMIGNGLVALLRNHEQLALLRGDPDKYMRPAVDEMLRLDGAITYTQVYPAQGAQLLGRPAHKNAPYLGLLTAGNHDPKIFDRPGDFIIDRPARPILTFGAGPHACLGLNLARLELDMVFRAFLERFPRMRLLDPKPGRVKLLQQQAFETVPVLLNPPA